VRIDRERLIALARRHVESQTAGDDVLAGYLIGSVAHGEPVLGGAADIDVVLIHAEPPAVEREIVPLSEDVHLDIAHHARSRYAQPRQLRVDPWLGPAVYAPIPLYDREHLFEWAQAAARGQYLRPDHAGRRATALLEEARRRRVDLGTARRWPSTYAAAVVGGANAVASLEGSPACGRRALLLLEARLTQAGYPEVFAHVLRLLGAEAVEGHTAAEWVAAWARAYDACARLAGDPMLSPHRRAYYLKGFQAFLEDGAPHALLFPMIQTWDRVLSTLEVFDLAPDHRPAWESALTVLGLEPAAADRRNHDLEAFLDQVEVILESWEKDHGV
jgi:hypothetical protein